MQKKTKKCKSEKNAKHMQVKQITKKCKTNAKKKSNHKKKNEKNAKKIRKKCEKNATQPEQQKQKAKKNEKKKGHHWTAWRHLKKLQHSCLQGKICPLAKLVP